MAHYPSTSVLACRVNLGGMTLAVPGATGFVAPAQRAVIGMSGSSRRPGSGTRYRDDENHVWARSARPPHVPVERSGYGTTKRGGDRRKHASFGVRYRDGSAGACNPKHAPRSGHRVGCLTTVRGVPDLTPKTSPAGSSPLGGDPCPHDLQDGSRSLDIAGHGRDQQSELQGIQAGPGPRTHHIASAVLPFLVNPDSAILTGYEDHAGESLPAFAVSWSRRRRSAPA
jgi:hypothetical protein